MDLKEALKGFAYENGADLIGFGNIERCRHAPVMMSPQGLFPGARTVVVMGIHHPDACIELGGEEHPQKIGPYSIQYLMNSRLDELSYRMASHLENLGYGAIPICSSNIWRYNKYKKLNAVFAPDVSHIYMPVVAGLADMGYNGLALTPEYGARNRFVTVITDLEIEPDPLIPPGTLCDRCMLCRKHCPSLALSRELGEEKVLKIDPYEYRFANKNLWRCAWGEHFDLDLDLEIPEKVTEEVIVEKVRKHGVRSGEMGQCLKFCVPRKIRGFDPAYSQTPMRQYAVSWNEEIESRAVADKLLNDCYRHGIEQVVVQSAATLQALGIDIAAVLPGGRAAITLIRAVPPETAGVRGDHTVPAFRSAAGYHVDSVGYDLTRNIEALGFRSVMTISASASHYDAMGLAPVNRQIAEQLFGSRAGDWCFNTVYTRKRFPERPFRPVENTPTEIVPTAYRGTATLTAELKKCALAAGSDLVGVASAERLAAIAEQLKPYYEGENYFRAVDKSHPFKSWDPEIIEEPRHVFTASDYLPGAKSVLVIGLRFHRQVLEFAAKPPAEAVGPYAFQTYVTRWQGGLIASKIVQKLRSLGYRAVMTADLMGLGSAIASPRGFIEDLFCNRFAAVAAGLGTLTQSGRVATADFGIRQRFMAIVTDAELAVDPLVAAAPERCAVCHDRCLEACPTAALSHRKIAFQCEGIRFAFNRIDINRCDWSKRYALTGRSGFQFLGSVLDEIPEGEITAAGLAAALRKHDPIKKYRPVACEPCVLVCPYARESLALGGG
ncbi:MAG: hypothetical protein WC708_15175 [Lentisphaeria bacterium]